MHHQSTVDRFWSKVDKSGECWIWTGSRKATGYGMVRIDGKLHGAHRAAYAFSVAPVPEGMEVCHRCDNPPCVRPEHLVIGTHQENLADRTAKGRTHRKLVEADVVRIRAETHRTLKDMAAELGVSFGTISLVRLRKSWRHI